MRRYAIREPTGWIGSWLSINTPTVESQAGRGYAAPDEAKGLAAHRTNRSKRRRLADPWLALDRECDWRVRRFIKFVTRTMVRNG